MSSAEFVSPLVREPSDPSLRTQSRATSTATRLSLATTMLLATGFVALGTYFFTREYWGPAIVAQFFG